jgi:hypothetical protein
MIKVDCLSFMMIDFYVPVLKSRLNSTDTSLQLSENIPSLRSVAYVYIGFVSKNLETPGGWGVLFIYRLYNVGDRTKPCGSPTCTSLGVDISRSTETLNIQCKERFNKLD